MRNTDNSRRRARKLQLRRETVRELAGKDIALAAGGYADKQIWQMDSATVDFEGCCCTFLCGTTNFGCAR